MSGFLDRMARSSARRVAKSRAAEPESTLRRRALEAPPGPPLALHAAGFDLFAEFKRRSPSAGPLTAAGGGPDRAVRRARAYARAGAAMVSVVTEPGRFGGGLADLRAAARAVPLPVLRKDFLVDPRQVIEARACGASGVLLILRLLDDGLLAEMLDACAEFHLFALLEAFDEGDLERAAGAMRTASRAGVRVLVGLNTRDLATLAVDGSRLRRLRHRFPSGAIRIAESGLAGPAEARAVAGLGYHAALVGGALMRTHRPGELARRLIDAGRSAVSAVGGGDACVSG